MTTEARQPKGIPAGGQFAPTAHTESGLTLNPAGPIGSSLARVDAALAVNGSRWNAEMEELRQGDVERSQRRRRIAGVRAASLILNKIPSARVLSYTRNPVTGTADLIEIRDFDDGPVYSGDDLDGPVSRGRYAEEAERRASVREAVRLLGGTSLPPEHGAQGITVHDNHEQLHLVTALEDGVEVLEEEDLTPEQASAQRMEAALSHWDETSDDPQTTIRDMLTDLRHYAAAHDLDLGEALDGSYQVFLEEHHDPAFKEGI